MINAGLLKEWPPAVIAATRAFQQGDLVARPPFFYVASAQYGVWQLTRDAGDPQFADEIFELDSESGPRFGMITTETCDVTEEDGEPRHPWISIAPVYDASTILDANEMDLLARGRMAYLRPVHAQGLPDGTWVVDARIEVPVEKSWLVGRTPIRSCANEAESAQLAGFLAGRRDRPVLSSELHAALIRPMRRWVERMSVTRRNIALNGIAEARISVAGSPLAPDGVGIIVVSHPNEISSETRNIWDDKWEDWQKRLDVADISLVGSAYVTYDTLTAREYRESLQVLHFES